LPIERRPRTFRDERPPLSFTIGALKLKLQIAAILASAVCAMAQESKQAPQASPPVHVNVINVCTPTPEERKDIATVLGRIPSRPAFSPDFEITRGRSAAPEQGTSNWVRMRREFGAGAPFMSAQYAVTVDDKGIAETLVFPARTGSDLVQVALEDKITSGTPASVFASDTPVDHIRVERMGKPSRVLARCADADQSANQSLFTQASDIMQRYRKSLRVSTTAGNELSRLGVANALPERTPAAAPKKKK
jgi:hypothetical protein